MVTEEEILRLLGVSNICDLHHIFYLFPQPDPDYWICHHSGDIKSKGWWFFPDTAWGEDMIQFRREKYPISQITRILGNHHYYNPKDQEYPVWETHGISYSLKNKYGNSNRVHHTVYLTEKYEPIELQKIIKQIQLKITPPLGE